MRAELGGEITKLKKAGVTPGLAVVLVGDNPASQVYVRMKGKACDEAGLYHETIKLPKNTTEADLMSLLERLNANPKIHGILVQLPLPKQIETNRPPPPCPRSQDGSRPHPCGDRCDAVRDWSRSAWAAAAARECRESWDSR